ncbi:AbrB/MazE/SpoVT family DNA-binding domain-containing protein [Conexibacter sp. JD483]|uniref:AbrB/MazE/SpoVT family DNA-binding domain-containing protein n=1 Tax=unclassified Conexibacter TaxID=2627773 RepID=UPI002715BAF7|nr:MULTISPECIES: AbrB/MazE/SpoVT family DNA-binding domain-containing protein [unclassified Conexibacter]MDO8185233.1 AbrB/MazE/SpoVT family DNA-binding domain-containing protein [Conexibacter sp. CPCC 205706]MDO8198279.1 AbrB/MazE/SpoVT family DNA-binding domain-containing protein [Conexibacter sp. CPCC 205762]MDR9367759.1 AbrB/MazE/SpoVT family DNA-binding domain-containing protein [Conexibacter sp. JD483]
MAHAERHVTIGERGRVVLPAAIRNQLGLTPGTRMLLTTEPDGSLRLRPYRAVADRHRGILARRGSGSAVDELLAERRREAAAEDG